MPKPLTVWITTKSGKFLKDLGVPDHLYVSQQAVEPGMGQRTGSQLGKEYNKAVYHQLLI